MTRKLTRTLGLSVLLVAVVAILAGCGRRAPGEAKMTLTLPLESDLQTLDPSALSDPVSSRVVWQIYEGLVGLNRVGEVVPVLADRWNTPDEGRTWVFHIRPHVLFHPHPAFPGTGHAREVSAADVIWSYKRMAKGFGSFVFGGLVEGFDAFVRGSTDSISGLVATAPDEVTVRLTHPDPSFLHRITSPYLSIMAHEVFETAPTAASPPGAIGTGPFRLARSSPGEVVLERNPAYWRAVQGNLSGVVFHVEKNAELRSLGLERGTYDLIRLPVETQSRFVSGGQLRAEFANRYTLFKAQTNNAHFVGMDVAQLADRQFRLAVAHAVDRQAITSRLLAGAATLAEGPVPQGLRGYHTHTPIRRDTVAARTALARSHYDGRELELLVSTSPNHPDVAQLVQADLAALGVRTRINVVDFNTFVARLFGKSRPPLFLSYSEWIYSSPDLILEQFRSTAVPNPNVFGYRNSRVDAMLDGLRSLQSLPALLAGCASVDSLVATEPPAAWLYSERQVYLARRGVSGFDVTPNNQWHLEDVRKAAR